MNQCEA